jgi:hypothetical protein
MKGPRAFPVALGRWLPAVVLLSACGGGGDKEILLDVLPAGACWQPSTNALSFSLIAATDVPQSDPPKVIPLERDCFAPGRPVEIVAATIRVALVQRGYVLRDVPAEQPVFVVVQPHPQAGCVGVVEPCLISDTVRPGAGQSRLSLNLTCNTGTIPALRNRCLAALKAPAPR